MMICQCWWFSFWRKRRLLLDHLDYGPCPVKMVEGGGVCVNEERASEVSIMLDERSKDS